MNLIQQLTQKRKSLLGNEKGLTLIELLAVIVILAIIAAIAIPAISGIISSTKTRAQDANGIILIDAARYSVINETPAYTTTGGVTSVNITLGTLVTDGYLATSPVDPLAYNKGDTYNETASFVTIIKTIDAGNIERLEYKVTLVGKASGSTAGQVYLNNITETALKQR